ncbi:hypothetical protein ACH4HG_41370 [Streptomyces coeruleorubidus]|uniref:hypothetical protein n=1 Tax=Streptomyces coeruleorubidus TaxID=116188 RepID=UPI001873BF7A|nr:hypothetical protein [Streptomyces bellus]GGU46262.1 hypothetical protein GCM10010244_85110 [Streptomyces bellus]
MLHPVGEQLSDHQQHRLDLLRPSGNVWLAVALEAVLHTNQAANSDAVPEYAAWGAGSCGVARALMAAISGSRLHFDVDLPQRVVRVDLVVHADRRRPG